MRTTIPAATLPDAECGSATQLTVSWSGSLDCYWAPPLVALGQSEGIESLKPFLPHPALDQRARVSILGDGNYGLTNGIEAVLEIDGHPELLRFGHATSDNLGGNLELINTLGLTIANEMLKGMGSIETS